MNLALLILKKCLPSMNLSYEKEHYLKGVIDVMSGEFDLEKFLKEEYLND